MLAPQAFVLRYRPLHEELIPELLRPLSDEQLRRRPHPHATPIAWHLWHMARAEDVGVNRLVTDGTQVLSDGHWDERMNLHVMLDEGVAGPAAGWLEGPYVGQQHGWYLFHCCLTHSFYHLGQAMLVRKLLGIDPPY